MSRILVCNVVIAVAVLTGACGAKTERSAGTVPNRSPESSSVAPLPGPAPGLLSELSVLATATVPSSAVVDEWSGRIARHERTLEDYIDFLLDQPAFGHVVAPEIIGSPPQPPQHLNRLAYYQLKTSAARDGTPIAYLTVPCTERQALEVEPWWALGTKIKVCSAAYRPDVWSTKRPKGGVAACNATEASPIYNPSSSCGCGPNLIRCWMNGALESQRKEEARAEFSDTIAYVTAHDLPLQALFSGSYTFRHRNLEGVYRWHQVEAERRTDAAALLRDLPAWPDAGQWAARAELAPGQHAGLLTSLANLYQTTDNRTRQKNTIDLLWCTGSGKIAKGVHTEDLLSVKATLQGRTSGDIGTNGTTPDWMLLAHRPTCTNCHARMDYSLQFFNAYPSVVGDAAHFVPALLESGKTGPLFINDKDDPRGEAPLTPAAFAQLALRQPEFESCMSTRFAQHVFGVDTSEADIQAVKRLFSSRATVKVLAKAALLRYTLRPRTADRAERASSISTAQALRARLGELCGDCHFSGALIPDLEAAALPRPLLLHSLDYVGSKFMPKGRSMPIGDRLGLIRLLINQLWSDDKHQSEAYEAIAGGLELPATFRWMTLQHAIDEAAGAPMGPAWNVVEKGTRGDQAILTPGVGVMTTLEAIRACKATGNSGESLEACVERATALIAR